MHDQVVRVLGIVSLLGLLGDLVACGPEHRHRSRSAWNDPYYRAPLSV